MAKESHNIEEILQDSLTALLGGEAELEALLARYPEHKDELRPRLEAVLWLEKRKAALDPPPGFVELSANRLVARLEREALKEDAVQEAGWAPAVWITRKLSGLSQLFTRQAAYRFAMAAIVVFALLFGFYGAARASQSALPGEPLYTLKIGIERVELRLTFDEVEKAELHIRYAQRRLIEIQELIQRDRYDLVAQAVADYELQVQKANQSLEIAAQQNPSRTKELLVDLQDTLTRQHAVFTAMVETVPTQVRPDIDRLLTATDEGLTNATGLLNSIDDVIVPSMTLTPLVSEDATSTPTPTRAPTATISPFELILTPEISRTVPTWIVLPDLDVTETPPIVQGLDEGEDEGEPKTKKSKKTKKPLPPQAKPPNPPPGKTR